ncbi:MAG: hypothetical protein KBF37_06980 [Saprospiraceae bacterium]|jgi:hypothetical protein|nr:hypothetical protein [Saprospiraceae bacterium]MBP9210045.1 hypothetical protein [Saprospiraceae bacterium]MBV6472892.1 hypothetical protein [Saprospiraceae bacterium]
MNNLNTLIGCFIFSCALNSNSFSQTYISPAVGYDFQKVISTEIPIHKIDFSEKGFGYESPLIGINFRQKLFDRFLLQIFSEFSHKQVRGNFYGGFTEYLLFHYNYIKNHFLLTYYWKNKWKIGGGITYNFVNRLYYEDLELNYISNQKYNYSENGWIFVLGLTYNQFEIEAYYYRRFGTPYKGDKIHSFHLHQIQSLGLRVSYDFKIFDGCKKKEKPELPPVNKMAGVD